MGATIDLTELQLIMEAFTIATLLYLCIHEEVY